MHLPKIQKQQPQQLKTNNQILEKLSNKQRKNLQMQNFTAHRRLLVYRFTTNRHTRSFGYVVTTNVGSARRDRHVACSYL